MKKIRNYFMVSAGLLLAFLVLLFFVLRVDVQGIGPKASPIGLAGVNGWVFQKTGVNLLWYEITDWLGVVAILVAFSFGVLGLVQLIKRKSIRKVDADILLLGAFYFIIIAVYVFFEIFVVNYRPVLLGKELEASFPSSHTMIVFCIMSTAILQFQRRIKKPGLRKILQWLSGVIMIVTIVGRLISGVHWFTDILAGLLLGMALVMLYVALVKWTDIWQKSK